MTDDSKPAMFGPSSVIDPAHHEPRSGKSALMNQMMAELAGKATLAETIIGNCVKTIPMKANFDGVDTATTVVIGPAGKGISADGAS